ncbi:MAG: FixH family protein [Rhizobiaceae bacterium]
MTQAHKKASQKKQFRFTGWHMMAIMVAFFGTIIAVNLTMAILASRTWTGLVVKNSYVASQQFNRDLEAAKVQNAKGWQSQLSYKNGEIRLRLKDKSGGLLTLDEANIFIGRPAFEQQDQQLPLALKADGVHFVKIEMDSGDWFVKIKGKINGASYRRDARFLVDEKLTGILQ